MLFQVFDKMAFGQLTSSPHLGTLFLQLTVDDMGICLPLNPLPLVGVTCRKQIETRKNILGKILLIKVIEKNF